MQKFHGSGSTQWLLWIMQHVGHCVHPNLVIGSVNSHSLLSHGTLVDITRRLVVVGKGNNRSTNTQNHGRVNLAVCVSRRVRVFSVQILGFHGNHCCFFFFRINVFHNTFIQKIGPCQFRFAIKSLKLNDMLFLQYQLLILNNEQRSTDTTSIRVDADFLCRNISHNRHFGIDIHHSSERSESIHQRLWITMNTDPVSIDKNLAGIGFGNDRWQNIRQVFRRKLFQKFHDRNLCCTRRNVGHERQVLDQSYSLSLGSLSRTHHTPMRIVQLTRLGLFTRSSQRSVTASQMG
mmetsp:Transcript_39028/g.94366  ORF Transcript_39028/g.94366 Transcript_39028/m.94366 type:complete len:291 (-) Transcript_39028:1653-2525(-)